MVKKKRSKRPAATGLKGKRATAADGARKDALEGLRDALDLTLTRVIEDDMGVDEARAVLRYLEKELEGFEKRSGPAKTPARRVRRRTMAASKSRRTGER
jgi:hypothetical protein